MDASWQPDAVNELKQQAYQRPLGGGVDLSQENPSTHRHATTSARFEPVYGSTP
jgi:hypothetical protein